MGNGFCVNEPGSYSCSCNDGFEGEDCVDIKECSAEVSPCDANAACIELEGSFDCKCNNGFTGDGFGCADINECVQQGAAACGANSGCTNHEGSYSCACNTGYAGETGNNDCEDVNECDTFECMANSACVNSPGSFACVCDQGYTMINNECVGDNAGDSLTCTDIDECASDDLNNCDANAT